MMSFETRATEFAALHVPGDPLILYNVWDAGSAKAVAAAGAKAIATGSWSVAGAQGFDDGQKLPMDVLLDVAARIVATVELPVTIDFEGAYAEAPELVAANVERLIATGAVGMNFEDQVVGGAGLYSTEDQSRRIAAARQTNAQFWINARTDLFLKERDASKHADLLGAALERAAAYAEAGANSFFIPGLTDPELIARFCSDCGLPVNVMMRGITLDAARQAGVARCSYGPLPFAEAMSALTAKAKALF